MLCDLLPNQRQKPQEYPKMRLSRFSHKVSRRKLGDKLFNLREWLCQKLRPNRGKTTVLVDKGPVTPLRLSQTGHRLLHHGWVEIVVRELLVGLVDQPVHRLLALLPQTA
jgi:hypothetical protein